MVTEIAWHSWGARYLGVDAQQFRNGLHPAAAEAAFGRDRKILDVLLRRRQSLPGPCDTVGMVYQTEAELRATEPDYAAVRRLVDDCLDRLLSPSG